MLREVRPPWSTGTSVVDGVGVGIGVIVAVSSVVMVGRDGSGGGVFGPLIRLV